LFCLGNDGGYFKNTTDLNIAQEQKLDLICKKLQLKAGDRVLDIGCGWGGFAKFAASRYGVHVTGLTISKEQLAYAREFTKGLSVDIKLQDYRDASGTVPLVVGGMIESDFWPRVFFIVFKSPLEGQTYIFRKGEPYAQILILPKNVNYNIMPMSNEEAKSRQEQEQILSDFAPDIATKTWKTKKNESFDNKYKVLSKVAKRDGSESVCPYLQSIQSNTNATKVDKQDQARRKFPRKVIKSCTGPQ
jgi:SAM-dependent methyltransferase